MKALIVSADDFEDSELLMPYHRLREAGVEVAVASSGRGAITGRHGYEVAVDRALDEVEAGDYAILVLPGGAAAAAVRREPKALEIARSFFALEKPVAAICHGPQVLISAGLLRGRRATCDESVADELRGAGALYEDREVIVDGELVTSRQPADLPAFMRETMRQIGLSRGCACHAGTHPEPSRWAVSRRGAVPLPSWSWSTLSFRSPARSRGLPRGTNA